MKTPLQTRADRRMTRNRYPARTPAGARLTIRAGSRWTRLEVDRIPITDATPEQAAAVGALARAAARYAAGHGLRGGVSFGCGRTVWSLTVPREDVAAAVEALFALERDEYEPARRLAADWGMR